MTADHDSDELLAKGITLLKANNSLAALSCFERAYAIKKTPRIQSYLGLCKATERGMITEAISLCSEAIDQNPQDPVHYLNLGKVYMKAGRKADCLDALRRGLAAGRDAEISMLLDQIGTRKEPVLPFVPRSHFLNRYAGLILHWLRLR